MTEMKTLQLSMIGLGRMGANMVLALRPTELIIFTNPRGGTVLMQANQTMGIDLPLKVLVWQDATGKTWVSHNTTTWLAKRHQMREADKIVGMMDLAMKVLIEKPLG